MSKGKYKRWLEPDGLVMIQGWARDGLTNEQIAHNMGCSLSTLKSWKGKYPAILTTLKKGKEVVDFAVENALLKKALSGDTTAMIFWLKNRRPDKWRDRHEMRMEGAVPVTIIDDVGVDDADINHIMEEQQHD